MLQDTLKEADGHHREEELGARQWCTPLPAASGSLAHTDEDYIAHVVDGNRGPIHALLAAGFEDLGPMKLHPGEFDGHIEHMMAPGRKLRAHACLPLQPRCHRQPDPRPMDLLACRRRAQAPGHKPAGKIDFSGLIDPAFLDVEVERIEPRRYPN